MCGIAGVVGANVSREKIEKMTRALGHRGPDGMGVYLDAHCALGQTRLKIIDLVTGDQPMSNEDGSVWVVYNGEIYNFRELRRDLKSQGHRFRTTSDTEVLVKGFEQWGNALFDRLDGIFAFAVWQPNQKRLTLVRDGFGIKPLHYYNHNGHLAFASEAKALFQDRDIPRRVDHQALHLFLNLRYIPGQRTLFEGVRRLAAGHFMVVERGESRTEKYFQLERTSSARRDTEHYADGLRHHLREAVRKQLVSDVPLGVYLSGGLDSSSLVAMMSELGVDPIKTFSMGFGEPTDELSDAQIVARHFSTEHHEICLDAEPLQRFPEVIWHTEEPKENVLQGFLLAQFARSEVTVALGGLGGDELFAGYTNNRFLAASQPLHRLVPAAAQSLLAPLSKALQRTQSRTGPLRCDELRRGLQLLLAAGDPALYYLILRNSWDQDPSAQHLLYGEALKDVEYEPTRRHFDDFFPDRREIVNHALWAELNTKMIDDFLLNEDRTSMAHGLEVRVPFLDRDLVRFACTIPLDLKIRRGEMKYIFRRAMRGVLPQPILDKKKWGFSFNPYYQFQKDLLSVAENILTPRAVEGRGWFNYAYLRRVMDHPAHPRLRWHYFFLWIAVGLEIWAQMFLDSDDLVNPSFELEAYYSQ